jgi:hypothetical protein
MIPEIETPTPQSRSARLKILLPIAFVAAGLALFLTLFWRGGHGHKGHARSAAAEGNRSPVGGSGEESNSRVTGGGSGGGSPVGGGPSRPASGNKGETWWYHEGKSRKGAPDDAWWSPRKGGDKAGSGRESPVSASPNGDSRAQRGSPKVASSEPSEDQPSQEREKPSHFSSKNPGEVAGQKGGPDDYWWRN